MAEDFKLAEDEVIVSMIVFNNKVLLATNKAMYRIREDTKIEEIKLQIETD